MSLNPETVVPGPRKLFYGWHVLGVTMTLSFFATVMSQFFTGAMLPHIEESTGWNRSSITFAVTIGTVTGGFLSPTFGRLADKYGPRAISSAGVLVAAGAMIAVGISGSTHIAVFYVAYLCGRTATQNTLGGVTSQTTMVNWFKRMRGRAIGLSSMAVPLGGATLVPLSQLAIAGGVSWETVYFFFAGVLFLVLFPLAVLVLRRRPEDLGLLPDGESAAPSRPGATAQPATESTWTLREAMRTRALWFLIGSMAAGACANSAISFHLLAYFKDEGVGVTSAALALSVFSLSGALASGLWGFLIERIPERLIGALTMFSASLLCLFLLTVSTPVAAIGFGALFGLAARGEGSILISMVAQYYGRESFGAIQGFTAPFQLVALGLGPTLAALLYDAFGQSYDVAFTVAAVIFAVSATFVWLARKPSPPSAVSQQLSAAGD